MKHILTVVFSQEDVGLAEGFVLQVLISPPGNPHPFAYATHARPGDPATRVAVKVTGIKDSGEKFTIYPRQAEQSWKAPRRYLYISQKDFQRTGAVQLADFVQAGFTDGSLSGQENAWWALEKSKRLASAHETLEEEEESERYGLLLGQGSTSGTLRTRSRIFVGFHDVLLLGRYCGAIGGVPLRGSVPYLIGPEILPTRIPSLNMANSMFYFGYSKAMPWLSGWSMCFFAAVHKVAYASKDDIRIGTVGKEMAESEHLESADRV